MRLTQWSLREPAGRAARVAALELLAKVRSNRDRLDDANDVEALHDFRVSVRRLRSWLRAFDDVFDDTLRSKVTKRLKRIAGATGASRDLEVHLVWSEERRRTLRGDLRRGADWLIDRLSKQKTMRDLTLRRVVHDEFDRTVKGVENAMSRYTANVVEPDAPFAEVAAGLVRRQASALAKALRGVGSMGDRAEAHQARIAAKRLRYLLDPLDRALPDAGTIVDDLGEMQDRLGELHDAQLFGSEIATIIAERLADGVKPASNDTDWQPAVAEALVANEHDDPVPGLLAFARRLRRAEETAFAVVKESWLNDRAAPLLSRVEEIAASLDEIAKRGRGPRRLYLLRRIPADMPAGGEQRQIEIGYLSGDIIEEQIRRETAGETEAYHRTVNVPFGADRTDIDDTISHSAFAAMWPLTRGRRVRASTTSIDANGARWTIHQFLDRELILAVVELDDRDTVPALPDWLEPAVERDVTEDASYTHRALAK